MTLYIIVNEDAIFCSQYFWVECTHIPGNVLIISCFESPIYGKAACLPSDDNGLFAWHPEEASLQFSGLMFHRCLPCCWGKEGTDKRICQ